MKTAGWGKNKQEAEWCPSRRHSQPGDVVGVPSPPTVQGPPLGLNQARQSILDTKTSLLWQNAFCFSKLSSCSAFHPTVRRQRGKRLCVPSRNQKIIIQIMTHSQMPVCAKAWLPLRLIHTLVTWGNTHTLISLSFAKLPKEAIILGIAAASVSWTDSSGLLLVRVRQGNRFTKYGLWWERNTSHSSRSTSRRNTSNQSSTC